MPGSINDKILFVQVIWLFVNTEVQNKNSNKANEPRKAPEEGTFPFNVYPVTLVL